MIKARIERDDHGTHRVYVHRAKFKHWFELGSHKPTDDAFGKALEDSSVQWQPRIVRHDVLFEKLV